MAQRVRHIHHVSLVGKQTLGVLIDWLKHRIAIYEDDTQVASIVDYHLGVDTSSWMNYTASQLVGLQRDLYAWECQRWGELLDFSLPHGLSILPPHPSIRATLISQSEG